MNTERVREEREEVLNIAAAVYEKLGKFPNRADLEAIYGLTKQRVIRLFGTHNRLKFLAIAEVRRKQKERQNGRLLPCQRQATEWPICFHGDRCYLSCFCLAAKAAMKKK